MYDPRDGRVCLRVVDVALEVLESDLLDVGRSGVGRLLRSDQQQDGEEHGERDAQPTVDDVRREEDGQLRVLEEVRREELLERRAPAELREQQDEQDQEHLILLHTHRPQARDDEQQNESHSFGHRK